MAQFEVPSTSRPGEAPALRRNQGKLPELMRLGRSIYTRRWGELGTDDIE
jgi:hypothetical protein